MKQILIIFITFLFSSVLFAFPDDDGKKEKNGENKELRELVILEKVSGIYCAPCAIAANIIHDFIDNGAQIGLISYQCAGPYSHIYYRSIDAVNMAQYYSPLFVAYPFLVMDGIHLPDYNSLESYETYYEQQRNTPPSFGLDIAVQDKGNHDYEVSIDVEKLAEISSGILRVVITERNIDQEWINEVVLNDICRKMLPNSDGSLVEIVSGIQNFVFDLHVEDNWVKDYISIVAYVQNDGTQPVEREIYGAAKFNLSEIVEDNDASIEDIVALNGEESNSVTTPNKEKNDQLCGNFLTPKVRLRNSGTNNLTTTEIKYQVNNEDVHTFNWSGNLSYLETTEFELSEIQFESEELDNQLNIWTENPNGVLDEDLLNDNCNLLFDGAKSMGLQPSIEFRTDEWPERNHWELLDENGEIVAASGTLEAYTVYNETFNLEYGCYEFHIYDETGDGLQNWMGEDGYLIFKNSLGQEIYNLVNFGFEWTLSFNSDDIVGVENFANNSQSFLMPNPATNVLNIISDNAISKVQLINIKGQIVFETNIYKKNQTISVARFARGIYFVKSIKNDGSCFVEKVVLQ